MDLQASMSRQVLSEQARKITKESKKLSAQEIARLTIKASSQREKWLKENVVSREFTLVDIPIGSAAVLSYNNIEIKASLSEQPIIVDINKKRLGQSPSGFIPKVLVIEGSGHYNAQRLSGKKIVKAWVGAEALKVMRIFADDQFGAQELQDKLNEQFREKFKSKKKTNGGDHPGSISSPLPWIREVYPFENYCIYSYDGDLFRQYYTVDTKKRTVALKGNPEEVVQKYADVQAAGIRPETGTANPILQKPMGNQPKVMTGGFMYNGGSPGSGVGPRIKIDPPARSLAGQQMTRKPIFGGGPGSGRKKYAGWDKTTGQPSFKKQDTHSLLKEHGYKVIPGSGGQGQVGYSKKIGSNTHFVYNSSEGWQHHALGKSGSISIAHTSGKTTDELEKHLRKQK